MKFLRLAEYFMELEKTARRNQMVEILGRLFKETDQEEIDKIVYLCQERLVPAFEKLEFGISEKLTAKALAFATGLSEAKIQNLYKNYGDLGLVGRDVLGGKGQKLSVSEVYNSFYCLATVSGEGAILQKIEIYADLLKKLTSEEVKYALRIPLGRLRLGIGDPTILDALSYALVGDKNIRNKLERAYNLCSDLGAVAKTLFSQGINGIEKFQVQVGKPIRMALAERLPNAGEIIQKIGPCLAEPKYDGFRCQVHKDGEKIRIFSRNLEDNTDMFPDIVRGVREQLTVQQAILEGEAVAHQPETGEYLPFQITVQRKRKYDIEEMQARYPLYLFAFDLLYADGVDYTDKPLEQRRQKLISAIKQGEIIKISSVAKYHDAQELENFFQDCVTEGLEGVMAKRPDAPYQAGARNFNWIKLKRSYQGRLTDTVDCVLAGYMAGKGSRARFGIGSLLATVYDPKEDKFKTIAKIGSGLSEEEWMRMKQLLDKIKSPEKPSKVDSLIVPDVWTEPRYVIEVQADEITRSPVHTCGKKDKSGYALRFPRLVGFIREDKNPQDATTVPEIIEMFKMQKKG